MFISIVIPAFNEEEKLPRCLDSLLNIDFPKDKFEIIVVDNNSTDKTKNIIQRYPVRYVFEPRRNRALARNAGIQVARGEFIASTDADCVVESEWLTFLLNNFTDESIAACAGPYTSLQAYTPVQQFNQGCFETELLKYNRSILPALLGLNTMIRKSVFEKIGYFDPAFHIMEDLEFAYRMYTAGLQIRWEENARVAHESSPSLASNLKTWFGYGFAVPKIRKKYSLALKSLMDFNLREFLGIIIFMTGLIRDLLLSMVKRSCVTPTYQLLKLTAYLSYYSGFWAGFYALFLSPKIVTPLPNQSHSLFSEKPNTGFIFSGQNQCSYTLNESATHIWKLHEKGKSFEAIVAILTEDYGIDKKTAQEDVRDTLAYLQQNNLISRA